MKPHALLLAATAAARPVVWFDGAEDVPKRVRRSRAVSVGVAYRSDDDAPAAVCLHDTCGGGDDACVDVVGPEATSQLNHGFGHCAPGAHALTVYAADGSSSATLEFDVAATPIVEAAVSQTSVTTNDTALITVAVAADGRGALELCTMSPCGDWLRHLHNFHCRPVPAAGETAFDVTVGFANCEPGQRSVSAIALPAGYLDAHPTTPIVDLWRVAGPGAYDEVVFTVAWDDASAANLNQLYFAPGDAPGAYDAATAYTTGGQFKQGGAGVASSWRRQADLLGALFGAGADIDVLEFGCGTMELAAWLAGSRAPLVGDYACVEPNAYLTEAGRGRARRGDGPHWSALQARLDHGQVFLAHNAAFAPALAPGSRVHLVYSHSVLSHAGSRTLDAYLEATSAFLHDDGIAVASRSASVYPWVSWHSPAGLRAAAARFGLEVLHVADDVAGALRSGMMQGGRIEGDWHEWVVLARPGMGLDAGARARLLAFGHNAP
ncbi:hypothetical protein SO694_00098083 [Aureococcus anophagefferens]|uniref:Methyltransferase domain-containing protein n=1 Tax=Aureococcus anophagefferens TaxID=44056 RepID=A0ABR1FSP7_AURAN